MKKKFNGAEFLRSWGITDPNKLKAGIKGLRYTNPPEKGVYWHYMSLWIRQRDIERYGTCISCDKPITMDNAQAGHFCPASSCGRDLLFDERNLNAECARCNGFDEGHLFGYEENLDKRYGNGTAQSLKDRYRSYKNGGITKDFTANQYADMIRMLPTYNDTLYNREDENKEM